MLYLPALFLSFGILHRIKGGFIPTKSTLYARLVAWAFPAANLAAAIAYVAGASLWRVFAIGFLTGVSVWLASIIPHAKYQDWQDGAVDWIGMATVGAARHAICGIPLAYFFDSPLTWAIFSLLGIGATFCYAAAYRWLQGVRWLWLAVRKSHPDEYPARGFIDLYDATYSVAFQVPTDWAELFVGIWFAVCFILCFGAQING